MPSRFLRDLPAGVRRGDRDGAAAPNTAAGTATAKGVARGAGAGRATSPTSRARACRRRAARPRHARRRKRRARFASNTTPRIEGGGLQVGAKLRHPSFGIGEVRAWQGAGNDMKVTMRFPGVGVKTILARFLARP